MLLTSPALEPARLRQEWGWELKPEGLCRADVCVPLPSEARLADGTLDAQVVADRLAMPLVRDEAHDLWALGPEGGGRALHSADMPQVVLPDLDGNPFDLATLHGQKVLLVAWASW